MGKLGRPPKYETAEEMQGVIGLYFTACKLNQAEDADVEAGLKEALSDDELLIAKGIDDVVPTISGLAYTLGMSTEAFRNYEQKDDFLATVKRAKQRVEMSLEQRLAGNAVTGSIFSLKNNFGWKDKSETEHSGNVGLTDLTDEQLEQRLRTIIDGQSAKD